MPDVNWIAVLVAALASFVLGGLWYSPILLGKQWMRLAGITEETLKKGHPGVIFGGSFVLALVASAVFAMFLGPDPSFSFGAGAGLAAGLCWVAAAFGVNYLFERRPLGLFLINGGYNTVWFLVMGAILGAL